MGGNLKSFKKYCWLSIYKSSLWFLQPADLSFSPQWIAIVPSIKRR